MSNSRKMPVSIIFNVTKDIQSVYKTMDSLPFRTTLTKIIAVSRSVKSIKDTYKNIPTATNVIAPTDVIKLIQHDLYQ